MSGFPFSDDMYHQGRTMDADFPSFPVPANGDTPYYQGGANEDLNFGLSPSMVDYLDTNEQFASDALSDHTSSQESASIQFSNDAFPSLHVETLPPSQAQPPAPIDTTRLSPTMYRDRARSFSHSPQSSASGHSPWMGHYQNASLAGHEPSSPLTPYTPDHANSQNPSLLFAESQIPDTHFRRDQPQVVDGEDEHWISTHYDTKGLQPPEMPSDYLSTDSPASGYWSGHSINFELPPSSPGSVSDRGRGFHRINLSTRAALRSRSTSTSMSQELGGLNINSPIASSPGHFFSGTAAGGDPGLLQVPSMPHTHAHSRERSYPGSPTYASSDASSSSLLPPGSSSSGEVSPFQGGSPYAESTVRLEDVSGAEHEDVGESSAFRPEVGTDGIRRAASMRRNKPGRFTCAKCGNNFTAKHNLQNHENAHNGIRKYPCDGCHKKFGTSHVLARHVKTCKKSKKRLV